jgi:predicted house-cleaning noncanonical NTP pyrophosphatase (MazG superfamily)
MLRLSISRKRRRKRKRRGGSGGRETGFLIGGEVVDEIDQKEQFMNMMRMGFENAITKAVHKGSKPGNTWEPWKSFTEEYLQKRLDDEYEEYLKDKNGQELLDIMNMACFLYIQRVMERAERLGNRFECP